MNPLQILMDEHRVIERALAALVGYGDALARGEDPPRSDLGRFAHFFRSYADEFHHGKEEKILFRAMEEQGLSPSVGPLAVMLAEHVEGRSLVRELAEAGAGEGGVPASDQPRVRSVIRSFSQLLGHHIQKEDGVLYPMADDMLSESAWQSVESAFEHFARYETTGEQAEALLALVAELAATYAGPQPA